MMTFLFWACWAHDEEQEIRTTSTNNSDRTSLIPSSTNSSSLPKHPTGCGTLGARLESRTEPLHLYASFHELRSFSPAHGSGYRGSLVPVVDRFLLRTSGTRTKGRGNRLIVRHGPRPSGQTDRRGNRPPAVHPRRQGRHNRNERSRTVPFCLVAVRCLLAPGSEFRVQEGGNPFRLPVHQ